LKKYSLGGKNIEITTLENIEIGNIVEVMSE